jgi:hypothetical protein
MPRVGFEPTIPVFEWAKMVHALDGATAVIILKRANDQQFIALVA